MQSDSEKRPRRERLATAAFWLFGMGIACSGGAEARARQCSPGYVGACACPGDLGALGGTQTCLANGTPGVCFCEGTSGSGSSGAPSADTDDTTTGPATPCSDVGACGTSGDGSTSGCLQDCGSTSSADSGSGPVTCDPVLQDCKRDDEACYVDENMAVCAPDESGGVGGEGDPCDFIDACDPGFLCVPAEGYDGCDARGCCSAFCDTAEPLCEVEGHQCIPLSEVGELPAGLEKLGVCVAAG